METRKKMDYPQKIKNVVYHIPINLWQRLYDKDGSL